MAAEAASRAVNAGPSVGYRRHGVAPSRETRSLSLLAPNSPGRCPATSPSAAGAQHCPPHLGQHIGDLVEQPVRLVEPARGFGTTSRLAVPVLPLGDPGKQAGVISGTDVTGSSLH